jgi:peptide/nickel transport system substrate-binding protein
MKKQKRGVLFGAFFLLLGLMGVLFIGADAGAASGKPQGTMTWGLHYKLATPWLDPALTEGKTHEWSVLYAIHDALLKDMPNHPNAPSLAESYSVSDDGKVYEFKIRKGVKFHNGDILTAEDVKFSFDRFKGVYSKLLKDKVARVEIVNPNLIRFHLKAPWNDFLEYYCGVGITGANWIVPKKYVEKVGDDGFLRKPIGAGPYKFVKFEPGIELVVEAFDDYWKGAPHVKTLRLKSVTERTTALAMLKAGELDIAMQMRGNLADEVVRDPKLTYFMSPSAGVIYLIYTEQWNPKSPWSNVKVREAADVAIDRKTMVDATMKGAPIIGQFVPNNLLWAKVFPPPTYDPAKAKKLLAEAGYAQGFDGGTLYGDRAYADLYDMTATYWRNVGINIKVQLMERAAYYAAQHNHRLKGIVFDASSAGGNAAARLVMAVNIISSGYGHYADIDALMKKQAQEQNPKKREAILDQIQQLVHDKSMFCVLNQNGTPCGIGPRVKESALGKIAWFSAPYEIVELK